MRGDSILGFISGSSVNIWFMHSVFNLFKNDAEQRFTADWLLVYGPYIHQNRNRLANEFLETTNRDWLLMVDNDMVFTPRDVQLLHDQADEHGPGVYSAPYMIENGSMVCGPWDDQVQMVYHPMVALPAEPCRVGVVGAGFTLIHRQVLEQIGEGPFTAISPDAGEDISFSWRARDTGSTPMLVPAANPGHFKQVVLYPHDEVRNMIGERVDLVETSPQP